MTAREKTTGIEQKVEINSSFGLSEADIQDMVNQSVNNFDQDMKARFLAEAKIKGVNLVGSDQKFAKKHAKDAFLELCK